MYSDNIGPGANKGMFPSRDAIEGGARKFSKVGIVEVDNITIGWPKQPHRKESAQLADIVERMSEEADGYVRQLKSIHTSSYTTAYNILVPGEEYTIVAAGLKRYRGTVEWHLITQCGVKLRPGKSLRKIWTEWTKRFLERRSKWGSVDGVEWMAFTAIRSVRSRGKNDMKCELVE